jgi:pilus assembly protein CpaF
LDFPQMSLRFGRKLELDTPTATAPPAPGRPASPPRTQATSSQPVKDITGEAVRAYPQQPTDTIRDQVLLRIEPTQAVRLSKGELTIFVNQLVALVASERKLLLNQEEQDKLAVMIVDEMIGLGPLEPLLNDPTVSDILINGADMIYAERRGKLDLTSLRFRNNAHVLHVAQRIASSIGRSIDEASPMLDARLADGSRVNVIIPPLSLNGPTISIRKFSRHMLGFSSLVGTGSVSPPMARALEIAARCRLNIIVSGGTGSGKTTMLNALSSMIDEGERIITIEDAAELQLQQEHVVRLETRPANIEGQGHIDQRALVKNALRMRPDRIIMGECRGEEAFDMMQAMNTGHAGSMSTIHANTARDALARIENMMMMANGNLPTKAIRGQIASAVDMIVHTERMRDGVRRVTEIAEVGGMEEDVITLGSLFKYRYSGETPDGKLKGYFEPTPSRPRFLSQIAYYGLADDFREALNAAPEERLE